MLHKLPVLLNTLPHHAAVEKHHTSYVRYVHIPHAIFLSQAFCQRFEKRHDMCLHVFRAGDGGLLARSMVRGGFIWLRKNWWLTPVSMHHSTREALDPYKVYQCVQLID